MEGGIFSQDEIKPLLMHTTTYVHVEVKTPARAQLWPQRGLSIGICIVHEAISCTGMCYFFSVGPRVETTACARQAQESYPLLYLSRPTHLWKHVEDNQETRRNGFAHLRRGWLALEAHGEPGLPFGGLEERCQHGVDYGGHVVGADVIQFGEKDVLKLVGGLVHDHTCVYGLF